MPENNLNSWFYPKQEPWAGVALAIHGLNVRPEKMCPLIKTVNAMGIAVLNVSLSGHGKNIEVFSKNRQVSSMETLKRAQHHVWLEEVWQAFQEIKTEAQQKKLPISLIGYSLGAVLGLELFSLEEKPFERMVLLAPPLAICRKGHLLKIMKWCPRLVLKSFSPQRYRANPGTPIAAYLALFQSISNVRPFSASIDIPTHIFLDPKDELVSLRGVEKYIAQRHLKNWGISAIVKSGSPADFRGIPHHLIIDEESLGTEAWGTMQKKILKHFDGSRYPSTRL